MLKMVWVKIPLLMVYDDSDSPNKEKPHIEGALMESDIWEQLENLKLTTDDDVEVRVSRTYFPEMEELLTKTEWETLKKPV